MLPKKPSSTTTPQSRGVRLARRAPVASPTAPSTQAATPQRKAAKASGGKNDCVALIAG